MECADDGAAWWKWTVHMFIVNPYGGKPDNMSFGRFRNVDEVTICCWFRLDTLDSSVLLSLCFALLLLHGILL